MPQFSENQYSVTGEAILKEKDFFKKIGKKLDLVLNLIQNEGKHLTKKGLKSVESIPDSSKQSISTEVSQDVSPTFSLDKTPEQEWKDFKTLEQECEDFFSCFLSSSDGLDFVEKYSALPDRQLTSIDEGEKDIRYYYNINISSTIYKEEEKDIVIDSCTSPANPVSSSSVVERLSTGSPAPLEEGKNKKTSVEPRIRFTPPVCSSETVSSAPIQRMLKVNAGRNAWLLPKNGDHHIQKIGQKVAKANIQNEASPLFRH